MEDWSGALALWTRLGVASRQAPLLERLGRLEEALTLYRQEGMEREARACELRLLERRKAWAEAAAGWEALDRPADAARAWERAGNRPKALEAKARGAERAGDPATAGEAWLEAGRYEDAARCFREAGDKARTALALGRHYESAGEWGRAAAAFRLARQPEDSARNRARSLEASRPGRAARIWEKLGNVSDRSRAFDLYVQAGDWPEVARLEDVKPEPDLRLLAHVRELVDSGAWTEAANLARARIAALTPKLPQLPWFIFLDKERQAWQEVCQLRALEKKCQALEAEAAQSWRRAARLWAQIGETERAATARRHWISEIRNPVRQARAWFAVGETERAIGTLEEAAGLSADAARGTVAAWQAERSGRWQEAAALWRSLGREDAEARCLAKAAPKANDGPAPAAAP